MHNYASVGSPYAPLRSPGLNYNKRTSTLDLYKICNDLGIKDVKIIRKSDLKKTIPKYQNIIINLDDYGAGSHWVALNTSKKLYFDTYSQLAPFGVPSSYKRSSTKKELQSIEGKNCGPLCCLWLYYINNKSNDEFYKLFRDVYK